MTSIRVALIAVLLVVGTGAVTAGAACAPPEHYVDADEAVAGGLLPIHGQGFQAGCDDTVEVEVTQRQVREGGVCGRTRTVTEERTLPGETVTPYRDLQVSVVQGARSWPVATVDGPDFELEIRVPEELEPGPATVRVSRSVPIPIAVDFLVVEA
jgi:hypothetical protein